MFFMPRMSHPYRFAALWFALAAGPAIFCLTLLSFFPNCTPAASPSSTVTAAENVAATATTVVADAEAIWPVVLVLLPPASQANAQTAFNAAIFTANHAILTLDDAIQAALSISPDAGAPNLTLAIGDVAAAVASVVAIITNLQSLAALPDAGAAAVSDLVAHAKVLK
jgi:hypothetical protein